MMWWLIGVAVFVLAVIIGVLLGTFLERAVRRHQGWE